MPDLCIRGSEGVDPDIARFSSPYIMIPQIHYPTRSYAPVLQVMCRFEGRETRTGEQGADGSLARYPVGVGNTNTSNLCKGVPKNKGPLLMSPFSGGLLAWNFQVHKTGPLFGNAHIMYALSLYKRWKTARVPRSGLLSVRAPHCITYP